MQQDAAVVEAFTQIPVLTASFLYSLRYSCTPYAIPALPNRSAGCKTKHADRVIRTGHHRQQGQRGEKRSSLCEDCRCHFRVFLW